MLALLKLGLPAGGSRRSASEPGLSAFVEGLAGPRHASQPSARRWRVAMSQQWQGREAGVEVDDFSASRHFGVWNADALELTASDSDDAELNGHPSAVWKHAIILIEEMWGKGIVPSATTYAAAITACAEAYQFKAAMGLLKQAKERGVHLSADVYNAGIAAATAARRMKDASRLFREMKAAGVEPTAVTYQGAIHACRRSNAARPAVKLLQEMREHGLAPDVETFNAVIRVCAQQQEWEHVQALLEDMSVAQLTPDSRTYDSAIYAAAAGGHWAETLRFWEQSRQQGFVPANPVTYAFALEACAEVQNAALAKEILSIMKGQGLKPSKFAYAFAIRALEQDGQWEAARELESEKAQEAVEQRQLPHLRPRVKTNLDWGL